MRKIDIARDFSPTPVPRYASQGPASGEAFRKQHLEPPLNDGDDVEVDLDGIAGYTGSFLEEAFGGLVRVFGPGIRKRVTIVSPTRPHRADLAHFYFERAVVAR